MNKQELIERIEGLKNIFGNKCEYVKIDFVIEPASELDEPEAGHADEAPRYVKNILARLRELPLHDREVWLKAIMGEFEQDFSRAKWREGYEQGKVEGLIEREKVTVPQFVGDFIAEQKKLGHMLSYSIDACMSDRVAEWYWDNSELFARAWLDGYEVEKEKWYTVKMRATKQPLFYNNMYEKIFFSLGELATRFTRKELEEAGFGWVFDCPGMEVEEVK